MERERGDLERLRLRDDRERVSKACESRVLPRRPHILHTLLLSCALGCSVFSIYVYRAV